MNRRNFLYAAALMGAGAALPFPTWAERFLPLSPGEVQPSLSSQFILLKIQKLLLNSGLFRPDLERLLVTDLNSPAIGNAFSVGRFAPSSLTELEELLSKSYEGFTKKPGDETNRRLLAYALGALAFTKSTLSFSSMGFGDYLSTPSKSADLDYLVLKNFYMRSQTPQLQNQDYLVDLLHSMTTRTYVRYHTLKCTEDSPMEWLDHTIAYRGRLTDHYAEIAGRFAGKVVEIPDGLFEPSDPALHILSPGLNQQRVTREMLGELIAVPSMHSAIGLSILGGVKVVLDYPFPT